MAVAELGIGRRLAENVGIATRRERYDEMDRPRQKLRAAVIAVELQCPDIPSFGFPLAKLNAGVDP